MAPAWTTSSTKKQIAIQNGRCWFKKQQQLETLISAGLSRLCVKKEKLRVMRQNKQRKQQLSHPPAAIKRLIG